MSPLSPPPTFFLSPLPWVSLANPGCRPSSLLSTGRPIPGPRLGLPGPHKVNKPSATEEIKGAGASWGWEKPVKIRLTARLVLRPRAAGNRACPAGPATGPPPPTGGSRGLGWGTQEPPGEGTLRGAGRWAPWPETLHLPVTGASRDGRPVSAGPRCGQQARGQEEGPPGRDAALATRSSAGHLSHPELGSGALQLAAGGAGPPPGSADPNPPPGLGPGPCRALLPLLGVHLFLSSRSGSRTPTAQELPLTSSSSRPAGVERPPLWSARPSRSRAQPEPAARARPSRGPSAGAAGRLRACCLQRPRFPRPAFSFSLWITGDPVRPVPRRGGLAPRPPGVGPRRQPGPRHSTPPCCGLGRPRSSPRPRPSLSFPLTLLPTLRASPGSAWPRSVRLAPASPPEPALTLAALPHAGRLRPESTAGSGPRDAGQPGLRVGRWVRIPLPPPPRPRGRSHPGSGAALDLRGCSLGPQLPPPPPPPCGDAPPLTSTLSISLRPPPPVEGVSRVPRLRGPRTPARCGRRSPAARPGALRPAGRAGLGARMV
ncbi:basic proline-rich protein-like [Phyllostomus hastatus]|uniref:basic proline-rich protein-like n=1 Tax=Phyllostomus hastatus TaxID=9423 RepID=UPI001E680485|nr:basic proline-rich protein-like [Phyllostomus hastatus]